jgi:hypothetical protein
MSPRRRPAVCSDELRRCLACGRTAFFNIHNQPKEADMLWTIIVILLILWLLGFTFHVAGSLIHLLLVVAVVVLIINLVTGRRTV